MCAERHDGAPGHEGRVQSPRHVLGQPLHPQAMQIDARAFSREMPAPRHRQIDRRCAYRCRVFAGIRKCVTALEGIPRTSVNQI